MAKLQSLATRAEAASGIAEAEMDTRTATGCTSTCSRRERGAGFGGS